jgi:hypothetical protein
MRKKFALAVGINDYPGIGADLSGCVNDARDWADLLGAEGYSTTTLLDAEATRANIVSVLGSMVQLAGFGDRIVFTYSGHGTWVPDRDLDEPDRRDEALVCHDYESGGLLLDDTLQRLFAGTRYGTGVLVLSDSCHSGTMVRSTTPTRAPEASRFVSPAVLFNHLDEEHAAQMEQRSASVPRRTASLISGCADEEYSYDASFNGRPNGAFTRAALDTYAAGIRLGTWHGLIRQWLPSASYPQSPQLTATPYRRYARAM